MLFGHGLAFRAVTVAAGVVGDSGVCARVAGFDMAAHSGGPAMFDMPGGPVLLGTEPVADLVLIEIEVENLGHLGPPFSRDIPD